MGLDLVEFIMATEVAFGVDIADSDAERIVAPRHLIAYLRARLPAAEDTPCLTQQAFYRVRDSVAAQSNLPRAALRPSTALEAALPGLTRRDAWRAWGRTLGAGAWPSLPGTGWLGRRLALGTPSLGAATRHLVIWGPAAVKRGAGWTDREIEACVVALIEADLGVDMSRHTLDAGFVDDLRVD